MWSNPELYEYVIVLITVGPVIVTRPQTQNVTAGQSFTLTCNATGYPVPSIEWTLNGKPYVIRNYSDTTINATGLSYNASVLEVSNATINDTGVYQCIATNVVSSDTQDAIVQS